MNKVAKVLPIKNDDKGYTFDLKELEEGEIYVCPDGSYGVIKLKNNMVVILERE